MKVDKKTIMNTAMSLFQKDGFDNVTVDMICKKCGVTKGSFYHHFKSKNEVLLCSYESLAKQFDLKEEGMAAHLSPIDQLWYLFEYDIDITIDLGADLLHHLLMLDIRTGNTILNPYLLQRDKSLEVLFLNTIRRGQDIGEIRQGEPSDLLFAFISGVIGIAVNWSSTGGKYDEKSELRKLFFTVFT